MNARLLFFLLVITCTFAQGEKKIEVTCFDVAQGNAGLVVCYDPAEKLSPWLVDAGCKHGEETKGKTFKKNDIVTEIAQAIKNACTKLMTEEYYITVSHPDEDHYNLIPDIVAACATLGIRPKKIVLGGIEKLYNQEFRNFLKEQRDALDEEGVDEQEIEEFIGFPTKDGDTTKVITLAEVNNLRYEILPALKAKTNSEKNAGSLVARAVYGTQSFLFSGDATGKTTAHVMKYCPNIHTQGGCLDHHGADTHGSNSAAWLKQLKPELIAYSAGMVKGFAHPQRLVIARASQQLLDGVGVYHPLFVGSEKKSVDHSSFRAFSSSTGYGLQVTNQPLYGTLDQGTLLFTWNLTDTEITFVPSEHQKVYPDQKSCILATLTRNPRCRVVSPETLTSLNLSGLGIDDARPKDKEFLCDMFSLVIAHSTTVLQRLFLDKNAIHLPESIKMIAAFIAGSGVVLALLNMETNTGLLEEEKVLLKNAASRKCTVLV